MTDNDELQMRWGAVDDQFPDRGEGTGLVTLVMSVMYGDNTMMGGVAVDEQMYKERPAAAMEQLLNGVVELFEDANLLPDSVYRVEVRTTVDGTASGTGDEADDLPDDATGDQDDGDR